MTKKEVLADPESCLNKAADDEPIFVLRAQDVTAAETILFWIQKNVQHYPGVNNEAKLVNAFNEALDFQEYKGKRKIAD